jgi:copper chaperone CopZ
MTKKFILQGLDCSNCAAKMEQAISRLDGVKEVSVNFITQKMIIDGDVEKMSGIVAQAEKIIKGIESQVVLKKA